MLQRVDRFLDGVESPLKGGNRYRRIILALLAFSIAFPLAACGDEDDSDQPYIHIVENTPEIRQDKILPTLPRAAPTARTEVSQQQIEINLGRQASTIIEEVAQFSVIGFDVSGMTSSDTLVVESRSLQGNSSWQVHVTTYEGDILVDLYADDEFESSFRLNDLPHRLEIKVQDQALYVHAISQYDIDLWGILPVHPDVLSTSHRVTVQQPYGSGRVKISNVSVR